MTNPQVISAAFAAGQEKLREKRVAHPASDSPYIAGAVDATHHSITKSQAPTEKPIGLAPVSVGSHSSLPPGYSYGHRGMSIYPPKRNSKEVEAVLGEDKYTAARDPYSREEMILKQDKADNEIKELKATVLALMAGMKVGEVKDVKIIPEEPKKPEKPTELSMEDLRVEAKELGIKTARMSKIDIARAISEVRKEKQPVTA